MAALNNLAIQLALLRQRLDEALELINRALELAGPLPTLLDSRAIVYLARDESKTAIADLDAAIATAPRPVWFFHKAQALAASGDEVGAEQSLSQARRLKFTPAMVHPLERDSAVKLLAEERRQASAHPARPPAASREGRREQP